jgi:hypothetical protein
LETVAAGIKIARRKEIGDGRIAADESKTEDKKFFEERERSFQDKDGGRKILHSA